jgi:aspartyl-tRNA(Asn)/glutamyl-tRNA(Gln) amidotransferase subunit B
MEASHLMRTKETEQDYRYFPAPDLLPMRFEPAQIEDLRRRLPELPAAKLRRYKEQLGLGDYDAELMTADRDWAAFFEEAVALGGDPKAICNWMNSDFAKLLNDRGTDVRASLVQPGHLVELTRLIDAGTISGKIGKSVFRETFESGRSPEAIVSEQGLTQVSDEGALRPVASDLVARHPDVVDKFRSGQTNVIGFFVGLMMKETGGRANPQLVQKLVREALEAE